MIELLVVMLIMALLMSILAATLSKVRSATKSFTCKNKLKTVVGNFMLFSDEYNNPYRGGESDELGSNRFRLSTFQESMYEIGDFWNFGRDPLTMVPYKPRKQPMICSAGPQKMARQGMLGISQGAITPVRNVSTGCNMRLSQASVKIGGRWVFRDVILSSRALDHPWVPLVFDVDGTKAWESPRRPPFFSAPAAGDSEGQYADDKFWFPAFRHGGKMHAGFIGGHIWSSSDPTTEYEWDWQYQPPYQE